VFAPLGLVAPPAQDNKAVMRRRRSPVRRGPRRSLRWPLSSTRWSAGSTRRT